MSAENVNNDSWMLEHYGYTKQELRDMMMEGWDITAYYDGDPIDLL